jgi:hypothetical protein
LGASRPHDGPTLSPFAQYFSFGIMRPSYGGDAPQLLPFVSRKIEGMVIARRTGGIVNLSQIYVTIKTISKTEFPTPSNPHWNLDWSHSNSERYHSKKEI